MTQITFKATRHTDRQTIDQTLDLEPNTLNHIADTLRNILDETTTKETINTETGELAFTSFLHTNNPTIELLHNTEKWVFELTRDQAEALIAQIEQS